MTTTLRATRSTLLRNVACGDVVGACAVAVGDGLAVLVAAVAVWASWRSHRLVLGVAAFLLAVFTFIGGFSIGAGYLPASGLLLLAAALAPLLGRGQRKSVAA